MNQKISIIVPVYKVEKYLNECIESIINQTYKNLEIILVDDGSPDNCPMICDKYALDDLRIKVIHKKNAGLMAAWISGLELATGEYIGFVDSDDFIELDMYEVMIKSLVENDADLIQCNMWRNDGIKKNEVLDIKDLRIFSNKDV